MTEHWAPPWCRPYLGKPFLRGACGPDSYDCYGIVRVGLRERFAIDVPALDDAHLEDFAGRLAAALADPAAPWLEIPVKEAQEGDVLVVELGELHVGLVVSGEWMLHARQATGVELARWRRSPWYPAIAAAYRHRELVR